MPAKNRKVRSKLRGRVQALESMLGKTFENKVKDYDSGVTPQTVSTAGYVERAFLRDIAGGADNDDRVGDKITLMSQTFRGVIRAPAGTLDEQQNQVRILIVENIGWSGLTDLDLTDVLQKGNWALQGNQVFISPYKTAAGENKRYRVHYDKVVKLNKTDKGYFHFKKRISYGTKNNKGKVITFSGPLSVFPNNHRMCMFVISDSNVTAHPDISWTCRNIYKDA